MKNKNSDDIFNEQDFPISQVRRNVLSGTGVDIDEYKDKPLIAIVNSATEINPGHMHLGLLASRVRDGINAAGGAPFECNVPAPCDALAEGNDGMKFVLPQRELIADTVETHIRSMRFDAMVMIASCDKIIPGMLLAAARLDLPTIFLTGGPSTAAIRHTRAYKGTISPDDYEDLSEKMTCLSSASCGSCEIMGTANTFQCLTEALGISLPGSAVIPGFHADRGRAARRTGHRIVEMVKENLTAKKLLTKEALENALMISQAIGGSTNAALHLPALAHELEIDIGLKDFNRIAGEVPTLLAIAPNGPFGIIDFHAAGGVPAIQKRLEENLNTGVLTCTGKSLNELLQGELFIDAVVIPDKSNPYKSEGGTIALFGNLAPEGSVIKQSAVNKEMRSFSGPARVFESEEEALNDLREKMIKEGEVLVIRNEGPKGGPGMPETLAVTMALSMSGFKQVAMITDGRFSGASAGPCVGHISPEAVDGGPIGLLRDGDIISIDLPNRSITVDLTDSEIEQRRKDLNLPLRDIPAGYMRRYIKQVVSAAKGAYLEL